MLLRAAVGPGLAAGLGTLGEDSAFDPSGAAGSAAETVSDSSGTSATVAMAAVLAGSNLPEMFSATWREICRPMVLGAWHSY